MKNPSRQAKIILFAVLLFSLASTFFMYAASADTMTVNAEATPSQPHVGDTLTVDIKIPNAQNLFGVDVTLDWNPSVLQFISATPQLGVESHSGGVLHESNSYPIEIDDNSQTAAGEYHLLATATGQSTPGFSGSGTIVTLKFNVTSTG
ncbi:MAG: cohesin domain-containing protein, partial [Desulfomonilaceae bacterium]